MKAIARVPGSCGELVQGRIDGVDFLVTCPVDCYSSVTAWLGPGPGRAVRVVGTGDYRKSARAAETALERAIGRNRNDCEAGPIAEALDRCTLYIEVHSAIPRSKGMASSTADVLGSAAAAAALVQESFLDPGELAEIALSIEPSDGLMYPGIAVFDHISGRIRRNLGQPPVAELLVIDFGGEVDTLEFNRRPDLPELNRRKEGAVRRAFELVRKGIESGDLQIVAEGATLSALANQPILPKPGLEELLDWAYARGSPGICAAHSGSVVGVVFEDLKRLDLNVVREEIARVLPGVRVLGGYKLRGGGVECARVPRWELERGPGEIRSSSG